MKKVVVGIGLLIIVIVVSAIGLLKFYENKKKENYDNNFVGIYYNNNLNGKEAFFELNDDGTCNYPTGESNYKWTLSGEYLIIEKSLEEQQVQVFMENDVEEKEINDLKEKLMNIEGVTTIEFISKEDAYNTVKEGLGEELINDLSSEIFSVSFIVNFTDSNDDTYNEISKLENVKRITRKKAEMDLSRYKARIVNNGLILHDHYFQKIK